MTTIARIAASAAALALLAAPAHAQKVTYDYHRAQDFTQLRTFSIKDAPRADSDTSETTAYDSPLVRQNTNAAIAAQLEGRGMVRDDDNPDVFVIARRSFEKRQNVYSTGWYGYGWGHYGAYGYAPWYGFGPTVYVDEDIVGTLTVDVVNAKNGQLLWRGLAERDAHPNSKPEKRLERINREVTKMFRKYPASTVATSGRATPKPTGN